MICKCCKKEKDKSNFYWKKGLGRITDSKCKYCLSVINKKRKELKKIEFSF